jgi:hypothetical protein
MDSRFRSPTAYGWHAGSQARQHFAHIENEWAVYDLAERRYDHYQSGALDLIKRANLEHLTPYDVGGQTALTAHEAALLQAEAVKDNGWKIEDFETRFPTKDSDIRYCEHLAAELSLLPLAKDWSAAIEFERLRTEAFSTPPEQGYAITQPVPPVPELPWGSVFFTRPVFERIYAAEHATYTHDDKDDALAMQNAYLATGAESTNISGQQFRDARKAASRHRVIVAVIASSVLSQNQVSR